MSRQKYTHIRGRSDPARDRESIGIKQGTNQELDQPI